MSFASAAATVAATAASCASRTSCSTCYNQSSLCHWCSSDNSCHAIGSYYGCSIGVGCYQEECMRKQPEAFTTTPPSFLEFLELFLLFGFVLCCAGFCINVANSFKNATTSVTTRRDERYVSLGDIEDVGGGQKRVIQPTQEQIRDQEWSVPIVELKKETALGRGVHWVFKVCCTFFITLVGIFLLIVFIFYPHAPTYSVCNSELDWKSALSSLASLSLSADYDVSLSIHNPNVFDIRVDSVNAVFTYENIPVASAHITGKPNNIVTLRKSSVNDVVLPLTFKPESIAQAYRMNTDNTNGKLKFSASFSIKGVVMGFYYFDVEVNDHVVDMSTMGDQSLCAPCNI